LTPHRTFVPVFWMLMLTLFLIVVGLLPTAAYGKVPHYSQARSKAAIRAEAKREGYGKADIAALLKIAFHESRWHNFSKSKSGCLGLFQLTRSKCRHKPWWDPTWNTKRALRYCRHRYGTPRKAWRFWRRHHWW
jgi:hypothetical protein